jgi:hypothetical protein
MLTQFPCLYFSSVKQLHTVTAVCHLLRKNGVTKFHIGNPEGKTLLERLRSRWEDKFNMNIREIWYEMNKFI